MVIFVQIPRSYLSLKESSRADSYYSDSSSVASDAKLSPRKEDASPGRRDDLRYLAIPEEINNNTSEEELKVT